MLCMWCPELAEEEGSAQVRDDREVATPIDTDQNFGGTFNKNKALHGQVGSGGGRLEQFC